MQIISPDRSFNFLGRKRYGFIVSGALLAASVLLLLIKGLTPGIDFSGGTLIQIRFQRPVSVEEVRRALSEIDTAGAIIQHFGSEQEVLIRLAATSKEPEGLTKPVREQVTKVFGKGAFKIRRVEVVGPKVGRDLVRQAIMAIVYAMIGLIIYITIRFEFKFGVAAILALIHDIALTLGAFSLSGKEISLPVIASILTVVGYSLNDTIVVFDRIRENLRKIRKEGYESVVNSSVNETLSRTLLTSGTTLIVVVTLFLLGGEVIHDFSFALIIGVIVGTYSSIFVASPVVVLWRQRQDSRRRRTKLATAKR